MRPDHDAFASHGMGSGHGELLPDRSIRCGARPRGADDGAGVFGHHGRVGSEQFDQRANR